MQILLVAATELEIKPFITKNPAADILITGVGVPATIYHLTKRLLQIDYDLVIQAGLAGSFRPSLLPGQVVQVKQDTFADLGVNEKGKFHSVFEMGFAGEDVFPYNNAWLVNPENNYILPDEYLPVSGITINTITDDEAMTDQQILRYEADIETMEGAALHYACLSENVSFLQLRAVSNYVGERDKSKWEIQLAIRNLSDALEKIYASVHAAHQVPM